MSTLITHMPTLTYDGESAYAAFKFGKNNVAIKMASIRVRNFRIFKDLGQYYQIFAEKVF
ncbi:MAG: hypothetical protein ACPLZF_00905 [Nitrososphaeria archaeon]